MLRLIKGFIEQKTTNVKTLKQKIEKNRKKKKFLQNLKQIKKQYHSAVCIV